MAVKHLTDEQAQAYIDDSNSLDSDALKHLEECRQCLDLVNEYKLLFNAIPSVNEPEMSADFTALTMAKITALEQPQVEAKFDWQTSLLVGFGTVAAVSVMIYLFGYKAILDKLQTFSITEYILESSIFTSIKELFTEYGDVTTIIVFAVLIIAFFAGVEYILKKYKAQKISLFSI